MAKRNQILRIRINDEERETIAKNAGDEVTVSAFVRALALGAKPPRTRRPTPSCDPALVRELSRIGNNLNQLARTVNQHRKSGFDMSAAQVLAELSQMSSALEQIREEHST